MDTMRSILDKYHISKAIIYGSRAMGNYREGSDIDLTLLGDVDHRTLARIAGEFDDSNIPYTVDLSAYDKICNQNLKEHINRVGKVFYQ